MIKRSDTTFNLIFRALKSGFLLLSQIEGFYYLLFIVFR
jgi:hypothetical protein